MSSTALVQLPLWSKGIIVFSNVIHPTPQGPWHNCTTDIMVPKLTCSTGILAVRWRSRPSLSNWSLLILILLHDHQPGPAVDERHMQTTPHTTTVCRIYMDTFLVIMLLLVIHPFLVLMLQAF